MRLRDLLTLARAAFASAVMFMAGAIVPALGGPIMLFAPTPVLAAAIGFRHASWRAIAMVSTGAALAAAAGGIKAGVGYLAMAGMAAIVMTCLIEKRQPFERVVVIASALMIVVSAAAALAFSGSFQALVQALHRDLVTGLTRSEKLYSQAGLDLSLSPDTASSVVETTLTLIPSLMAISAALLVLANLGLFWRIGGRQQRVGYPLFSDLVRWSSPEWLIWVLLVNGFGLFIPISALRTVALNCFVAVAAIYFCQGLAIMAFYFRMLAMPLVARALILIITMVQPVLAILVCVAGVLDLWIDFRRLKPPSAEARNLRDLL